MTAPATTTLKHELLDLEKKNWEAWKAGDAKALESIFDDNYIMVMEEGITETSKSEFVKMMLEGDTTLKSYKLYEDTVNVRELAPGVAFIAYKARPEMKRNDGETLASDYFFGATFVKKGGRWVAAAGSASKAETPAAR